MPTTLHLNRTPAEWLTRLVRIPSVSPAHAGPRAGVPGEGAIAAKVASWFAEFGGEVIQEDFQPGRPNTYGVWRNPASDRWIAIDVHYDTVGVENMSGDPFDGALRDGRVWGRGAVDDKASLAVALSLLEAMHHARRTAGANLIVAAVADEEMSLGGAKLFDRWLRANGLVLDELLVAEPTGCAPCHGHKGVVRYAFDVQGLSAHTSQPHHGRNAISAALRMALAFEQEHARLQTLPPSPVGAPSLSLVFFNAGRALNIVPDAASVAVDRRVVHGERALDVATQLERLAASACPLPVRATRIVCEDGFYQAPESAVVGRFSELSGAQPTVVPYGSDASAYGEDVARNRIVLGPGSIDQAHGAEEWVEARELDRLARIYAGWWGIEAPERPSQ